MVGQTAKPMNWKISLISETLALPTKGARSGRSLDSNDQLIDKGWFVVSGVSSSDRRGVLSFMRPPPDERPETTREM